MKQITISVSEYERLKDLIAQADTRCGLEMAALERRYQERITQMQRDHQAEVTRLESAIAHQAEQVEKLRGEWQICFEDWRKQMAGDQCSKCGFQHYGTSINRYKFCPACGAPMTDEAVDMVMERLEALYEET